MAAVTLIFTASAAQAKVSPERYAKLRQETYEAAQGAVVSSAADAMTNVSARLGEGKGELAELVNKREALLVRLNGLRKQVEKASDTSGASVEAVAERARVRGLRDQESALSLQLDEIDGVIDQKFPAFVELTRPMPLKVGATQALLGEDEAVLLIVPAPDATYLWAVTHAGFDWARSSLNEADITAAVQILRKDLDPSTATRGSIGMAGAPAAPPSSAGQGPAGFDRKTAFKLYQELVAPLEPVFSSKKVVFIATTGALQSLPFSVLVTAEPQGADNDRAYVRETQWLIDRYALVTLPAISSLRTLRCLAAINPHPGCVGGAQTGAQGGVKSPRPTLAYAGLGAPTLGGDAAQSRSAQGWEQYSNGELADPDKLRALAPLPGAESEIGALSELFRNRGAFVRTRDQLTETLVKSNPEIRQAAIIHFATHALMGGESGSRGEPGLVLTPPTASAASPQDDGLLSASEAATLDLRADFVVLSACNTARADGTLGADGLAGLARSFFYAGAKSLLVSHWSVDDKSTKELMVTMFSTLDGGKVNRAAALQQAIQKVKADPAFVEPRFWAPFVLVGESRTN